jgi:uncharacterized protein YjbJ (UPF0337 family)
MTWEKVEDHWPQLQPRVRAHWFRLTDEDIAIIAGRREVLSRRLQDRYGLTPDQAEREIEAWAGLVKLPRAA